MNERDLCLPTFLYIGAGKSGSSWIYETLRHHPEIFVPDAKDLQFFDSYYNKGLGWYAKHFLPGSNKACRGEISHNYFLSAQTLQRIATDLPSVHLICCLREPVERTVSAYVHGRALGMKVGTFAEFAQSQLAVKMNSYFENLLPVFELFSQEQIKVLFFDDLLEDAQKFAKDIYTFVGVDDVHFSPPCLEQKVLAARRARSEIISSLTYSLATVVRKCGFPNLVGRVKRHPLFEKMLYQPATHKPELDPEILKHFRELYWQRNKKLEELLGRDLPHGWNPES